MVIFSVENDAVTFVFLWKSVQAVENPEGLAHRDQVNTGVGDTVHGLPAANRHCHIVMRAEPEPGLSHLLLAHISGHNLVNLVKTTREQPCELTGATANINSQLATVTLFEGEYVIHD